MAAQSSVDSCAAMSGGGRCGVRTRDPFGVNEVRYHCANRPGETMPEAGVLVQVDGPLSADTNAGDREDHPTT